MDDFQLPVPTLGLGLKKAQQMKQVGLRIGVLFFLLGCAREELTPEEVQILGKWQLKEYCIGPGSGNCTPQSATAIHSQVLDFKNNGSFTQKIPQPGKFQTPVVSSGEYRIDTVGTIRFRFDNTATLSGEVRWGYVLSNNVLTLSPQCFEGCSYTYQRL